MELFENDCLRSAIRLRELWKGQEREALNITFCLRVVSAVADTFLPYLRLSSAILVAPSPLPPHGEVRVGCIAETVSGPNQVLGMISVLLVTTSCVWATFTRRDAYSAGRGLYGHAACMGVPDPGEMYMISCQKVGKLTY